MASAFDWSGWDRSGKSEEDALRVLAAYRCERKIALLRAFLIRRCAWHMLDHAWEMEDRDLSTFATGRLDD